MKLLAISFQENALLKQRNSLLKSRFTTDARNFDIVLKEKWLKKIRNSLLLKSCKSRDKEGVPMKNPLRNHLELVQAARSTDFEIFSGLSRLEMWRFSWCSYGFTTRLCSLGIRLVSRVWDRIYM